MQETQEELSRERSSGVASRSEMEDWRARVDQYKATIKQLEGDKMMIQKQLKQQEVHVKQGKI